jgi:hypothetical protein
VSSNELSGPLPETWPDAMPITDYVNMAANRFK